MSPLYQQPPTCGIAQGAQQQEVRRVVAATEVGILVDRLDGHMHEHGGSLAVFVSRDQGGRGKLRTYAEYTFGREAEDSPMAGGAVHAIEDNLGEALAKIARGVKLV